jgi:DNA-binding transcriptional MerR regulator
MTMLTIGEAATRLHTTPSTIRSWEQRLGYPVPTRSPSGRRLYDEREVALLGDALSRGLSISSAIRQVREETGAHADLLQRALAELRFAACDRLLEAAIAVRGVGRALDEIVMEALDDLLADSDQPGVNALAIGWVKDRALWYRRLATAPVQSAVVVADSSDEVSGLRAASDMLQLQLRMRGFSTHTLVDSAVVEYRAVAELVGASAIVFVGGPPATVGRSPVAGTALTAVFRGEGARAHGGTPLRLSPLPRVAADELWKTLCDAAAACVPHSPKVVRAITA